MSRNQEGVIGLGILDMTRAHLANQRVDKRTGKVIVEEFNPLYWEDTVPVMRCFLCAGELDGLVIQWQGFQCAHNPPNPHLLLHSQCAVDLALHLIRDAGNAHLIEKGSCANAGVPQHLRGKLRRRSLRTTENPQG